MSAFKRFQSQKVVDAAVVVNSELGQRKVRVLANFNEPDGDTVLVPVPEDFFGRGAPAAGDYLVRYENNYLSWSPKAAFDGNHAEVEQGEDGKVLVRQFDDSALREREAALATNEAAVAGNLQLSETLKAELDKKAAELQALADELNARAEALNKAEAELVDKQKALAAVQATDKPAPEQTDTKKSK